LWLKRTKRNKANTIAIKLRKIRYLQRHVNLWDDEAVSAFIQDGTWSDGYKETLEYCYLDWSRFQGFDYKPHYYNRTRARLTIKYPSACTLYLIIAVHLS
jgi:hypothetical protein